MIQIFNRYLIISVFFVYLLKITPMKKILFLLLCSVSIFAQIVPTGQETSFDYGIQNTASQLDDNATYITVQTSDGVQGKSNSSTWAKKIYVDNVDVKKAFLSTGLIKNGLVTTNADPTKFNITAGIGIISNFDNPENPTSTIVSFPAFTGITPTYLTSGNITYVAITLVDGVPVVLMQATPFDNVQRRNVIALGATIHSNLTTINLVNNISAPTNAGTNQLHDLMEAIGALNVSGNKYSANGANLSLNKSAGDIFKLGVNFANNWRDPHKLTIAAGTALTFRYRTQDGTEGSDITSLNPSVYDLNNVLTSVPVNRFSIQTVTLFQTGQTRIQYGQSTYATMAEAESAIITRAYNVESNIAANGIARAYIILRHNASDLTNATTSKIIEAQKFGGVASGGIALTDSAIIAALGYTPENVANKQNSLAVDGTGVKYPTVDAVNVGLTLKSNDSDVVKLTGNQTISGTKTFIGQLQINSGTTPSLFFSSTDGSSATISNNAGNFIFKRFTSGSYIFKNTVDINVFTLDLSGAGLFANSVTSTGFIKSGATSTDALLAGGASLASPETQNNKSLDILTDYLNDIKYPSVKSVYDWVTTEVVGAPLLGAIVPTDSPTGVGEAFWFATTSGTYTNFGGGVVGSNEFAVFARDSAGVFTVSKTALDLTNYLQKTDNIKIEPWTAKSYLSGDQVNYLGKDWFSNAATITGDVPGTSSKWVDRLIAKADLKVGKNIFNKATAIDGYAVSNGTGLIFASATYAVSDYIAILPSTAYFCNNHIHFAYYTSAKVFISGGNSSPVGTSPANAYFIRYDFDRLNINTSQLEQNTVGTPYEAYINSVPLAQIPDLSSIYRKKTDKITLYDSDWATLGKNLFNKAASVDGFFVNWTNGLLAASASYTSSDYIAILPSTAYFCNNNTHFAYYTAAKVFISGGNGVPVGTSPANAYFIRYDMALGVKDVSQLEQNTVGTSYSSYGFNAPALKVSGGVSGWNGKTANCMGDSITAQNSWQPFLSGVTGLNITSFGIGGTKLSGAAADSFWQDARVNALNNSASLVTVLGGTNDWAGDVVLGLENSTNTNEFYGALNVLITKLLTKYNTAGTLTKFLFIGTTYGELYNFAPRGWANAYTNNAGLTTKDYAEAIKKRCLFYGIPYCDTSNLGWNNINIRQYITDDGGLLHPNTNGGRRLAEIINGKLKQIEPIN